MPGGIPDVPAITEIVVGEVDSEKLLDEDDVVVDDELEQLESPKPRPVRARKQQR